MPLECQEIDDFFQQFRKWSLGAPCSHVESLLWWRFLSMWLPSSSSSGTSCQGPSKGGTKVCEQSCIELRISEFQNHITKRFGILLRALKFLAERLPNEEKGKQSEKTEDGKAIESLPYVSDQSTCTPEDKKWAQCLTSDVFSNYVSIYIIYIVHREREREKIWIKIKIYTFHLRFIFSTPPVPSRTTSAKVLWPSLSDASQLWPSQKTLPPNPGTMWGFNVDVFWF